MLTCTIAIDKSTRSVYTPKLYCKFTTRKELVVSEWFIAECTELGGRCLMNNKELPEFKPSVNAYVPKEITRKMDYVDRFVVVAILDRDSCAQLEALQALDYAFYSNLFEHLSTMIGKICTALSARKI